MSDFKLQIPIDTVRDNVTEVTEQILANHGENFDAAKGDFTVATEDAGGRIVIIAKDVAKGDIQMLVEDLHDEIGDPDGEFIVRISQDIDHNGQWFAVDLDDDDY